MNEKKYYICNHCGNIVDFVCGSGAPVRCCGQNMVRLVPGAQDASLEKHVPYAEVENGKVFVQIGETAHPMSAEHHIVWISLVTDKGEHRRNLTPDNTPAAVFLLHEEKPLAVYAYCNLHGLWKKEL